MSAGAAGASTTATPPAFQHDLSACVGCHACVIACVNEHALAPGRFWRQIVTFNPERHPDLQTYHLSLACNHCLDAPCEQACPAEAIARDPRTGAVLIDADACIGCRYCSWVCPYDAPRFDESAGIMRKCTLCAHRLAESRQPACVSQCPTGALRLTPYDPEARHGIAGFPSDPVRPAITFVPIWRRPHPEAPTGARQIDTRHDMTAPDSALGALASKVSLREEWPLAVFTFLAVAMVAWQSAAVMGGPAVRPGPLVAMALVALAVSTAHLGRPRRAWRAALNWRRSWLSREVIAFPVFIGTALTASLVSQFAHVPSAVAPVTTSPPGLLLANGAALVAGLALLACVDRVYVSMATRRLGLDRVGAFDAAAFLAGVLAGAPWLAVPAGALRLGAAWTRPYRMSMARTVSRPSSEFASREGARPGARRLKPARYRVTAPWTPPSAGAVRTAARIAIGLGAPGALWLAGGDTAWVVALAFLGEALDRADFYDRLSVVTPATEMRQALERPAGTRRDRA